MSDYRDNLDIPSEMMDTLGHVEGMVDNVCSCDDMDPELPDSNEPIMPEGPNEIETRELELQTDFGADAPETGIQPNIKEDLEQGSEFISPEPNRFGKTA